MARDKEHLIALFTLDGPPFGLRYRKLGRARTEWKDDKKVIDAMIKAGTVKVVAQDRKTITYQYTPKP